MPKAIRCRVLEHFLKSSGVKEPEDSHIAMAEALVFSDRPSARASFPGGVTVARNYDRLEVLEETDAPEKMQLPCPGELLYSGLRLTCRPGLENLDTPDAFTVSPVGDIWVRSRGSGDSIRRPGGSKSLKKLFIDRKIPASRRDRIPVVCDDRGILGVYSIGKNLERTVTEQNAVTIRFEIIENKGE
jgi:tRNA(Ile)-lysidine synthase